MLETAIEVIKVSAQSEPKAVAGAIAATIRSAIEAHKTNSSIPVRAEVQAVGAGAVNQAVKSIAIARGYVAPNGIDLVSVPAFTEVIIEDQERTAIRFIVEER